MSQKSKKKTRWGCLAVPLFFTLLIGFCSLSSKLSKDKPSLARTSLPDTATEIQEHYEDTLLPPGEFYRLLKARMPRHEVEAYAHRVGATKRESGQTGKEFFSWRGGFPEWFDPQEDPLYYYYEQQYRILVGWEDGYVYFDATAW